MILALATLFAATAPLGAPVQDSTLEPVPHHRGRVALDPVPAPSATASMRPLILHEAALRSGELWTVQAEDSAGEPVGHVRAYAMDPRRADRPRRLLGRHRGRGRLVVPEPGPGEEVWVARDGYAPVRVVGGGTPEVPELVLLSPVARLEVHAKIPRDFPPERLAVQLEADRELVSAFTLRRRTHQEEADEPSPPLPPVRAGDVSAARWSHTFDFGASRVAEDVGAVPVVAFVGADAAERVLELGPIQPGVGFRLRVFDPAGGVFFDEDVPALRSGEQRPVRVDLPTRVQLSQGRILRADGSPAAGLEVCFGGRVPAPVAITNAEGEFAFPVLVHRTGVLLVRERLAGPGVGVCGLSYLPPPLPLRRALAWREGVRFSSKESFEVRLGDVRIVRVSFPPPVGAVRVPWAVSLFDRDSGALLTDSPDDRPDEGAGPEGDRFTVPAHRALRLVANYDEASVEVAVGPDQRDVLVDTPGYGPVFLQVNPVVGFRSPARVYFEPASGGAPLVRTLDLGGRSYPIALPADRYLVTAYLDPAYGGDRIPKRLTTAVTVTAGGEGSSVLDGREER